MPIGAIRIYALVVVMLVLLGVGYKCYVHQQALKDEISLRDKSITHLAKELGEAQKQMLVSELESERYQSALTEQSRTIELQSEKYKQAQSELTKWRADVKRYQSIGRHLPSQTIIYRSNCEDIKTCFDSLDGFSLDRMQ